MLYYWIVEISKDFKLGKIAFRKTVKNNGKGLKATGIVETTMATKIFVECKSCPPIKKVSECYEYWSLQTYFRVTCILSLVLNSVRQKSGAMIFYIMGF